MQCEWCNHKGICTYRGCSYYNELCGVSGHPDVCRYSKIQSVFPELSADELVKALRACANSDCVGCPYKEIPDGRSEFCVDIVRLKAADMLEKMKVEKQQWISVKDGPPKTPDTYFCCVNSLAFPGSQYVKPLKFCGNGKWWKDADVTHWMPLPKLPNEGNNHVKIEPA